MTKVKFLGTLVFTLLIGAGTFAFKTSDDTPKKVKDAFAKKFPMVKKVSWEKESETEWEAEFKMNKVDYSANFLEDGTWQETEHEIKKNAIPLNVKTTLEREFLGYKIEEAEISETSAGTVYEFELEKGEQMMEVAIDTNGKTLKKEIREENKEDKD